MRSKNIPRRFKKIDTAEWWIETVTFAFLPIIFSVLFVLLTNNNLCLYELIGHGELIISTFAITSASIIRYYKAAIQTKRARNFFYLFLMIDFFQLISYASFKLNTDNPPYVVYLTSAFCLVGSVLASWLGEKNILKGDSQ